MRHEDDVEENLPEELDETSGVELSGTADEAIAAVEGTKSYHALLEAREVEAKKKGKAKRPEVLAAIEAKLEALNPRNNQGAGADEDGEDPFADLVEDTRERATKEYAFGEGAKTGPQSYEDKMRAKGKAAELERRTKDWDKLSKHKVREDGVMVFPAWGHIMPGVKELRNEKGEVTRPAKEHQIVLLECPRCGKRNKLEQAANGDCYHCDLEFEGVVNQMIERKLFKLPEPR